MPNSHSNIKLNLYHTLFIYFLNLGLFLCGQDVMSLGLVSAALSGVLCASVVLKTNLFKKLDVLHKKLEINIDQRKRNKTD
jgi:hypothetical protein